MPRVADRAEDLDAAVGVVLPGVRFGEKILAPQPPHIGAGMLSPASRSSSRGCAERTAGLALGMYFTPSSFTPEGYDKVISRLGAVGAAAPPGRLYHVALEAGGRIQLFDVWESAEAFQAFGTTLVPILAELGIDPGEPQASPFHNLIAG